MTTRLFVTAALLLLVFLSASAQPRNLSESDSASLRANLLTTVGKDFKLVKDEFKPHPSGPSHGWFWLAHLQPKSLGHFALQYSFKPKDERYSHVEHDIYFTVAPKDCRRGPPSYGVYSRFCLGDTIVIPVLAEASDSNYEFELRKTLPAADEDWRTFEEKYPTGDRDVDKTPVDNPAAILRYVGRSAYKAFHRNPGYTLGLHAHFEAAKTGRLNLLVSSTDRSVSSTGSIPIIVVDRGTPVTLIAGRGAVRGYSRGPHGEEYVSSTVDNSYGTALLILQPGDRLSVQYLSVRRDSKFEREGYARDGVDPAEATKPVITVHPFAHDPTYDYGGWLVDYHR